MVSWISCNKCDLKDLVHSGCDIREHLCHPSPHSHHVRNPFLGGAIITYIRSLSRVNISMDINTFIGLDSAAVQVCAHSRNHTIHQ